MNFDWWTLALQTVNFAVLVWLLHRFLYRPVLRMVDARRAEVAKQLAAAAATDSEAKARLAAIDAERAGIAAERDSVLRAAAAQAEEAAKTRHAEAERQATALVDAARKTLADERDRALGEARRAALDLGVEIARRLLAEVPTELRAEAWLERIERYLAGLSPSQRAELANGLQAGGSLRVTTATALPDPVAREWRTRLGRAVGDAVVITFDVDAGLVAGAELHLPNAALRFSWRSTLEAMRAEIEDHGDAG